MEYDRSQSVEVGGFGTLVLRCVQEGEDALIVKTADTPNSFQWYVRQENKDELLYCMKNTDAILSLRPDAFGDKIFTELCLWQGRFRGS